MRIRPCYLSVWGSQASSALRSNVVAWCCLMLFGRLCAYLFSSKTWKPGLTKGPIPSCATPRRTTLVSNCVTLEGFNSKSSLVFMPGGLKSCKKNSCKKSMLSMLQTVSDETECCPESKSLRTVAIFLTDRLSRPKKGLFQKRLMKPSMDTPWSMDNEQEACARAYSYIFISLSLSPPPSPYCMYVYIYIYINLFVCFLVHLLIYSFILCICVFIY